jgi:DNA-binding SARP family transcriptional activator
MVVEVAGQRFEATLPSRQGRLAFAYLVLHRGRGVSRGELVSALWPGQPPAAAQTLLTQLLSRLRHALPDGMLQGRSQLSLQLEPDAWVDVEVAARALPRASRALAAQSVPDALSTAREGLEILQAPLLAEVDLPWVDEARREQDGLRAELLELAARAALRLGGEELPAAEDAARGLIVREPLRESAYGLLMEVHAARGDVAQALRIYDELRTLLRDELGIVPSAPIRGLAERFLLAGDRAAVEPIELPAPLRSERRFLGRERELEALRACWRAAGGARLVVLAGDAGIGKTSLAARLAREIGADEGHVLYGRCDEDPPSPYQPFGEALRQARSRIEQLLEAPELAVHVPELARLVPTLWAGREDPLPEPAPNGRGRFFEAVTDILDAVAHERPLLLVLDDLHWADQSTASLLRHFVRHASSRILLLGLYRDREVARADPFGSLLAELRREGPAERLHLSGLGEADTAELARRPPAPVVRWIQQQTGGNPFFVTEIVRALPDDLSDPADLDRLGVPEGVKDLIGRRVARLGDHAARALSAAAVIGPVFDLMVVQAVTGVLDELVDTFELAVRAGLVVESGDRPGMYAFAHALVRDALYESMGATRRANLHRRIAEALARPGSPASAAQIAHHAHQARHLTGPEAPVRALQAAADEAARAFAYEGERAYLQTAVDVLDEVASDDDETRCRLLIEIGDLAVNQAGEVNGPLERAAAIARRHGWGELLARAAAERGRIHEYGAIDGTAVALLEESLVLLGPADNPDRARTLGRLAETLAPDPSRSERVQQLSREGLDMARRIDDPDALITAIRSRASVLARPDQLAEVLALLDESIALSASGFPARLLGGLADRASVHMRLGELDLARADVAAMRAEIAERRLAGSYYDAEADWLSASLALLAGDLATAERLTRLAHATLHRLDDPDAEHMLATHLLPVRLLQGRGEELAPAITELHRRRPTTPLWRATLALLEVRAGEHDRAAALLAALAAGKFAAVTRDRDWLGTMAIAADAAADVRDPQSTGVLAAELAPFADRIAAHVYGSVPLDLVGRAVGVLEHRAGRVDHAVATLERAVTRAQHIGAPVFTARTQSDLGAALLDRGRPGDEERAHMLLEDARLTAGELGLAYVAARIDALRTP